MFLIDDLQDKAAKNDLEPESLLSLTSKKEKHIYNYLRSQQRDDQSETTMRSSFYSTKTDSHQEQLCLDTTSKSQTAVS
jgi:hypothetical protein